MEAALSHRKYGGTSICLEKLQPVANGMYDVNSLGSSCLGSQDLDELLSSMSSVPIGTQQMACPAWASVLPWSLPCPVSYMALFHCPVQLSTPRSFSGEPLVGSSEPCVHSLHPTVCALHPALKNSLWHPSSLSPGPCQLPPPHLAASLYLASLCLS